MCVRCFGSSPFGETLLPLDWLVALWRNAAAIGFNSSRFGEAFPPLDSALRPLAKRSRHWILLFALWRNVPAVGFGSSPFGEALLPLDSNRRPLAKACFREKDACYNWPSKNFSARSRSAGVSMPTVSMRVIPTFIL